MEEYIRALIHALRSPLTAIFSNIELLKGGFVSELDDEVKEILGEIMFNARYMEIIMRNASDVVKIKDKDEIIKQKVNLEEVIKKVVTELEVTIPDIDKMLNIEVKNGFTIEIEPDMINRMIMVILFELLKFATEENSLNIILDNKSLILYYSDNNSEIFESKKIFNEIFFKPTQKHAKMNLIFFNKIFEWFDIKKEIKEDGGIVKFVLTFI